MLFSGLSSMLLSPELLFLDVLSVLPEADPVYDLEPQLVLFHMLLVSYKPFPEIACFLRGEGGRREC